MFSVANFCTQKNYWKYWVHAILYISKRSIWCDALIAQIGFLLHRVAYLRIKASVKILCPNILHLHFCRYIFPNCQYFFFYISVDVGVIKDDWCLPGSISETRDIFARYLSNKPFWKISNRNCELIAVMKILHYSFTRQWKVSILILIHYLLVKYKKEWRKNNTYCRNKSCYLILKVFLILLSN